MNTEKRNFYKTAASLVIPLALQNLINVGVSGADVIMLGRVGEAALSGASLGGQIYFIMNLFLFGLTSGVMVLASQYWGKGDTKTIEKILGLALKIALFVSLLFLCAGYFIPDRLMRIYTSDKEVIKQGVSYLRIVCLSYPAAALSMTYLYTLRSVEKPQIATIVYTVSLLVNVFVNALLIFGLCGFPRMEAAGAAVGTLIARIFEVLLSFLYDRKVNKIYRLSLSSFVMKNKLLLRDFAVISVPVIINELMWGLGMSMTAAILGQLGKTVSSAYSVVAVVRQFAQVVTFGISGAAAVMIGKSIGLGENDRAVVQARRFHRLSIIFGLGACAIVLLVSPMVLSFVSISAAAKKLLLQMLIIVSVIVIAQSHNCTMIVGIYRGGGDTRYGMMADMVSMWFGSILLGYLSAFIWKFDVWVTFLFLLSDEFIKIPMCLVHYYRRKWLNNITRGY